jgi:hypothetical protein
MPRLPERLLDDVLDIVALSDDAKDHRMHEGMSSVVERVERLLVSGGHPAQ